MIISTSSSQAGGRTGGWADRQQWIGFFWPQNFDLVTFGCVCELKSYYIYGGVCVPKLEILILGSVSAVTENLYTTYLYNI
jgi:hypothetical protein